MWKALRARRLGGLKFRRQHPMGGYVLDFYCDEARLVVEIDGGGHAEPEQEEFDESRTRRLEEYGLCVLRFWNTDVLRNLQGVLASIADAVQERIDRELWDD
jgi:adenine-specific DNA-methyltransferase